MSRVETLEDLRQLKAGALARQRAREGAGRARVIVGMGSCGIAAGARDTLRAVLGAIEQGALRGIAVTQAGCAGLCGWEPTLEVVIGETPGVTYGKVTPERAARIVREHAAGGGPIGAWVVGR